MGIKTGISWTATKQKDGTIIPGSTFNAWIGCVHYGPGCDFCYAEAWDNRNLHGPQSHWGLNAPRKEMSEHYWNDPLRWNKKAKKAGVFQKVFCSSLADVFEDNPKVEESRARLWPLIKQTDNLIWLLLTKRAEKIKKFLPENWENGNGYPNVWIGITTEDQNCADKRIPHLYDFSAKHKFLSVEPQLEEIDFSKWIGDGKKSPFSWMIFGGESGHMEEKDNVTGVVTRKATCREFNPDWMKKPIEQADKCGVSVFVKQMGTIYANANRDTIKESKGADPSEWPVWMQRQEFPA